MKVSCVKRKILAVALAACSFGGLLAEPVDIASTTELATALAANPSGEYRLTDNLDCASWKTMDFSGTLDGNGKTISNLSVPLFGTVSGSARIEKLTVSAATISHTDNKNTAISGFIAETVSGSDVLIGDITFTGCTLREAGTNARAGMVAGKFGKSGTIRNILIDATCMLDASNACGGLGGVCGAVTADGANATVRLQNCVNRGAVTISGYTAYLAGLVAGAYCNAPSANERAHVILEDCANYASLSTSKTNPSFTPLVNGFSNQGGRDLGDITFIRCVNYGDVTINAYQQLGGILGSAGNGSPVHMTDCANYGNLTVTTAKQVGGLVGALGYILNREDLFIGCVNRGNISGQLVGGLVGTIGTNNSYKNSAWRFVSCLQEGELTANGGDRIVGEVVGKFASTLEYKNVEIAGTVTQSDALIGLVVSGATLTDPLYEGNLVAPESEGLVDGSDVARLNAFRDCNRWKQGSRGPILASMPDEPAPDTITVRFTDAEDFDFAVLKTCVILRGATPVAPAWPEHEGYTFIAWDPANFAALQADTDIVAVYEHGTIEHTVRFFDDDGTPLGEAQTVEHGKAAVPPEMPEHEGYKFVGWDKDITSVLEDLDVTATFVLLRQEIATGEELALALASAIHPEVTYCLTEDIELDGAWTSLDFGAKLDGQGHVVRYTGTKPLFSELTGSVAHLVLDGAVEENPTKISGIATSFGLVAINCQGGSVSDVTLRSYTIEVSNSASGQAIAFVCGGAGDGARIEGCTVEESCLLRTRSCTAGGLVATTLMSDTWSGEDPRLLTIASCTNHADIVTFSSGAASLAGILADCSSADTARRPDVVITNCVNYGSFTSTHTGGIDGRFGGIVANRNANIGSGVLAGTLTLVDCANYGDIDAMGSGQNNQKTIGNYYGGILAFTYRLGAVWISRCQNRGRIGSLTCACGDTIIDGSSAGLVAGLSDIYGARPVVVTDSANYGAVYGGRYAGGIFGNQTSNADYRNISVVTTNAANYAALGTVLSAEDGGVAGEWIGYLGGNPKDAVSNVFGVWNSFFVSDRIVGATAGYEAHVEGCRTAVDDGYTYGAARKALAAGAEELGLSAWVDGKIDGVIYPELLPFCEKESLEGLMLIIR